MDNSLIVWLDGCRVMQDDHLSLKVMKGLWVQRFVQHDHSLSETCSLQGIFLHHAFDCKAYRLPCIGLFNRKSLVVDRFDLCWLKVSSFVRSKVQNLIWNNCSRFKSSRNNKTNTRYLINSVDIKFDGVAW